MDRGKPPMAPPMAHDLKQWPRVSPRVVTPRSTQRPGLVLSALFRDLHNLPLHFLHHIIALRVPKTRAQEPPSAELLTCVPDRFVVLGLCLARRAIGLELHPMSLFESLSHSPLPASPHPPCLAHEQHSNSRSRPRASRCTLVTVWAVSEHLTARLAWASRSTLHFSGCKARPWRGNDVACADEEERRGRDSSAHDDDKRYCCFHALVAVVHR